MKLEQRRLINIKGSAAAAIQSMIGAVQAGSIFSFLQSAGAGGSGLAVINALVSTSAGVGMGVVAANCAAEQGGISPSADLSP
jgi:hypothetical protein